MPSTFTAVSYARTLSAEFLAQLRGVLTDAGARLLAEGWHNQPDFQAYAIDLKLGNDGDGDIDATRDGAAALASLRAAIAAAGFDGVDTAVVPTALRAATRKLIIMDVDSTLIQQEVIELLAAHAGTEAQVAEVTAAAMRGELDFAQSLHHRVGTLAGLPESVLAQVGQKILLTEGAERLVRQAKEAGHVVAAVSGGFSQILAPLAQQLGLDFALANDLEIVDGRLTGKVSGDVVDRAAKAASLRSWARASGIDMVHTMAVGDGANDLDMMAAAGLGVAFNAKPAVRAAADAQINLPYLDVALALANI